MLLKKASEFFKAGKYKDAYGLYKEAEKRYGRAIIDYNLKKCEAEIEPKILKNNQVTALGEKLTASYIPFKCKPIEWDGNIEKYKRPPSHFPKNMQLPSIVGLGNDYGFLESELEYTDSVKVSIVILTYNRYKALQKTLTGILNQDYSLENIEVLVTDDGGKEDNLSIIKEFSNQLDVKYIWHKDMGFTPAAARNNGICMARNDFIILLDVDMFPGANLVKEYVKYHKVLNKVALIGPRKYVDLNNINVSEFVKNPLFIEELPEVITNNNVAGKIEKHKSVDWRLDIFSKTNFLKEEKVPFRVFASGNVAFSKKNFLSVGKFDENFNNWGHEDVELAFRFFNMGLYMIPVMQAWAYHQEPENNINETDRDRGHAISKEYFAELCPYYRHFSSNPKKAKFTVPKVSIYIPAYNAEKTIIDAIESVLNQTYRDIEICICDDGSSDNTLKLLETYYTDDDRVRWMTQKNAGIGAASNSAVKMCRGIYIGQLDSDDYLAEDVVEKCIYHLDKDLKLGLVYTSYENEYNDGRIVQGYNYPVFTREKMMTASIVHHFRMFRKLYWCRTEGFNERIKNAVDYDMYLKLSEVCEVKHLNIVGYRRRLHGGNTSILDSAEQIKNTAVVVNKHLKRLNLDMNCELESEKATKLIFKDFNE